MTLLISIYAAVISTLIWYMSIKARKLHIGNLCFMFWGASIMWLVDAAFDYFQVGEAYFQPTIDRVINDTFLGLSVVALALIIWIITLLIKDPDGVIHDMFINRG